MDETTAFHEAGHAFAAVAVGAKVVSVTIEPDYDDGPRRYGDTQVEWPRERFSDREFAENLALVALAGPVAEMVVTGDPYHPASLPQWSADWYQAMTAAAGLFVEEPRRIRFLEQVAVEAHQVFSRHEIWPFIGAIVDELVAHETLEGEIVHDIVEEWLRLSYL